MWDQLPTDDVILAIRKGCIGRIVLGPLGRRAGGSILGHDRSGSGNHSANGTYLLSSLTLR